MKLSRLARTLSLCGASLVAGCHGPGGGATTTTTGAPVGPNEPAISAIATTRCDREVACNSIGADHKYPTREACMEDLMQSGHQDLRAAECPVGINQPELDKCLAEIRGERCGNPLDTLSRLAACRTSALCVQK